MKVRRYSVEEQIAIIGAAIKSMTHAGLSCGELFAAKDLMEKLTSDHNGNLKTCSRCGKIQPATSEFFDFFDKAPDSLAYRCKECRKKYMNRYKRQTRKRNSYPSGDLEEIQRHRELAGRPPEYFPKQHKPDKATLQMVALESLAP